MTAIFSDDFSFETMAEWPVGYDKAKYDEAIYQGIVAGIIESGYEKPVGKFNMEEVKFSDDAYANVPFAYGEAAKQATIEAVREWRKEKR